MHPYVHCSVTMNSQDMEATQMSMNRLMHKDVVYNRLLLSNKKKQYLAVCDMDEPKGYYYVSKLSQMKTNTI